MKKLIYETTLEAAQGDIVNQPEAKLLAEGYQNTAECCNSTF